MAKLITVFGGLGAQGGSVVSALLKRGPEKYKVRVTTRSVDSEKAKALSAKGVEIVSASYDDYDSLVRAMTGAHGAWFITTFWEVKDSAKEIALGANVAKAAKEAGVQHLVFSSLGSPKSVGIDLPPFEDKIEIEKEIVATGVPYTFVDVAWYLNNLLTFAKPSKQGSSDRGYVVNIPIGPHGMHAIANEDVGEGFARIFDDMEVFRNKKVGFAGLHVKDTAEIADALNDVYAPIKFSAVSDFEGYRKATEAWGPTMFNMYNYYNVSRAAGFDVDLTRRLNPDAATTVKDFLLRHKDELKFE